MIWLLNCPRFLQRTIAAGFVILIGASIAFGATVAVSSLFETRNSINDKRQLLGRLQSIAKQLPVAIEETAASNQAASQEFLSGESETLIRANLQQRFNQIAGTQKLSVISVGNAPDFTRNEITYTGLQANVSGNIANLHKTLLALESSRPILFITNLTIRSTDGLSTQAPVAEPILVAQLRLYGALRPETMDKEAAE